MYKILGHLPYTLTPYLTCYKISVTSFYYLCCNKKTAGSVANSVYPAQKQHLIRVYSNCLDLFVPIFRVKTVRPVFSWCGLCAVSLTLSILGKIFSRQYIEIIFLFFPENRRQFAWNVKSCFLGKIRKISPILLSAELAQRVGKIKSWYPSTTWNVPIPHKAVERKYKLSGKVCLTKIIWLLVDH